MLIIKRALIRAFTVIDIYNGKKTDGKVFLFGKGKGGESFSRLPQMVGTTNEVQYPLLF